MKICVVGCGYVGSVCCATFSRDGHQVIGVDTNPDKVASINQGRSPVYEPGLDELFKESVSAGRLRATEDLQQAVRESELSLICVGTPSRPDGSIDLSIVESVLAELGGILKTVDAFHVVVMRSTVLPGVSKKTSIPVLESESGKKVGQGFGYASNPEFLREGTAVYDFDNPPKTVIGASDERTAEIVSALYKHLDAPMIKPPLQVAEMVKYAANAWHATKVAFANEIGSIAKEVGVDGQAVMDIFCQDTKLNISCYYMKPAFAFGGSCLPKDVKAITAMVKQMGMSTPLLSTLMESNDEQIDRALALIASIGKKRITLLGLSFKADTDDIRESPLVHLANKLLESGFELKIYDQSVMNSMHAGPSRHALRAALGNIADLLGNDLEVALQGAEIIVIGNSSSEFKVIPERVADDEDVSVVDLVRVSPDESSSNYHGICW